MPLRPMALTGGFHRNVPPARARRAPAPFGDSVPSSSAIAVTCKFSWLAMLCVLFKPTIEIDGEVHDGAWSRTELPVAAGTHVVSISWKYLWAFPVNRASHRHGRRGHHDRRCVPRSLAHH